MTKNLILPVILIAGLTLTACQEEPPEPEVTSTQAQTQPSFSTEPAPLPDTNVPSPQMGQTTIDQIERISMDEYRQLADAGEVVTVDVRNPQYYMEGHIPGAINIPAGQVASMIDMLPKGKKIVTYCTWTAEQSSAGAALIMKNNGVENVEALLGGFAAWQDAGLPVEAGM